MKCDCLSDCGDDPDVRTGRAELCDHAKKRIAERKAAQEQKLRQVMQLADAYAGECANDREWPNDRKVKLAREALEAKIKELTHGQA